MSKIDFKMKELKLQMSEEPKPVAVYIPAKQTGNLVFTASRHPKVSKFPKAY